MKSSCIPVLEPEKEVRPRFVACHRIEEILEPETEVRQRSEARQLIEGDALAPRTNAQLPNVEGIHFWYKGNADLLKGIFETLPTEDRVEFRQTYGWIAHLAYIKVSRSLMSAMLSFWDPIYNCYTFQGFDLTPTMEEYGRLLGIEPTYKVYDHCESSTARRQLARIIKTQAKFITSWEEPNGGGILVNKLVDFVNNSLDRESRLAVFALLVYGLLIFPEGSEVINDRVVVLFKEICHGTDPIMPILAETFRSLSQCRKGERMKFTGCAPLLTVWILNHLRCPKEFGFPRPDYGNCLAGSNSYLATFKLLKWPEQSPVKKQWLNYLKQLTEEDVEWFCPEHHYTSIVYACGNFNWVPLLGPWGGSGYAPNMFRRQFANIQFIPQTAGLASANFSYEHPESSKRIKSVVMAWEKVKKIHGRKESQEAVSAYRTWHDRRGKGCIIPMSRDHGKSHIEETSEPRKRSWDQQSEVDLREENNILRAQLRQVTEELGLHKRMRESSDRNIEMLAAESIQNQEKIDNLRRSLLESRMEAQRLQEENGRLLEMRESLLQQINLVQENFLTVNERLQMLEIQRDGMVYKLRALAARARQVADEAQKLHTAYLPAGPVGQQISDFLQDLHQEMAFYGKFS